LGQPLGHNGIYSVIFGTAGGAGRAGMLKSDSKNNAVINIGPVEQRKRAVSGWGSLLVGVALVVSLRMMGLSYLWRLWSFPFFFIGAVGLLQAREKT
jgi:hypothetical protein